MRSISGPVILWEVTCCLVVSLTGLVIPSPPRRDGSAIRSLTASLR